MERYDRQLRLWSTSGQERLANAHVWAIGKSLAMMECLKNLALAGVNHFTLTMNQEPSGFFFDSTDSPLDLQLRRFNPNLTVAFGIPDPTVNLIVRTRGSDLLQIENFTSCKSPIIEIDSELMNGSYELILNEALPVLQPHPEAGLSAIGINIWSEFEEFCDSFNLIEMDDSAFRHVPWCVLLYKARKSALRCNIAEVRQKLKEMRRFGDEENYNEAIKNAHKLTAQLVPDGIYKLIEHVNHPSVNNSQPFWQLVGALSEFISTHGALPISDEIPDMICDTESYIQLKELYRHKAERDANEIKSILISQSSDNQPDISQELIRTFCANSRFLQLLVPNKIESTSAKCNVSAESETCPQLELAPVAAFIGGIAAQESLKILMNQYTPLTSKLIYDGSTQETKYLLTNISVINNK